MQDAPETDARFEITIYNDSATPFAFVVDLISRVFALPRYEAEALAQRINKSGKWAFGPYPETIAKAIHTELETSIEENEHKLLVDCRDYTSPDEQGPKQCSFCGKVSNAVEHLFAGDKANICDECTVRSAGHLQDLLPTSKHRYTFQLLDWHFGDVSPDSFVKTSRTYPGRVRADLQTAIEKLFSAKAIRALGVKQQYGHEHIDLTTVWTKGRNAHGIAPLSFEEIDIGEAAPKQCQINGLWLLEEDNARYAAVLSRENDYTGGFKIFLEIGGPQGEQTAAICRRIFDSIEEHIREAKSYRGKVLSLEQSPRYGGSSTGITVHRIESVDRDQVILPELSLKELDRSIIRFCEQRDQLRELGLRTKRGVLFYGPPGTGKTHTIRYLASQLPGHTTFLVTAEQIGLLPEYFSLARLLQPVIFVIEDADLLAKSRERMHGPADEILLNQLLNEMDGLKEDADILFILSTNKPEVLEEALIARPGRIDQLIEFPRPDDGCRRRLMTLYGGSLVIPNDLTDDIVSRTEGVSASFIKELMRRLAQYSIEREAKGTVEQDDVQQALEEMLSQASVLNLAVLGGNQDDP